MLEQRLTSQLLAGDKAGSVVEVVERLLAVQAQDLRAARLVVRSRTAGLTAADVDDALERRELVVSWLNRGTLHLVRSEDWPWLHALTTPQLLTSTTRRLRQEGVDEQQAERGVRVVEQRLQDGPHTREQLRDALDDEGVPTAGQALVHLLFLTSTRGVCVRGPVVDGQHAFVDVRTWLPETEPVDRERALGELARRYLEGHWPADDRDLATWAGTTLGDARRGLAQVEPPTRTAAPLPPPTLLGGFDPLLHGWVSRDVVLSETRGVITSNGIFKPVLLVRGRAVGTWRLPEGRVVLEPFEPLDRGVTDALEQEAADVERFLRRRSGAPAPELQQRPRRP